MWGMSGGGTERSDRGFAGRPGSGHPPLLLSSPQIGHRDFDVEKRLRRDLRRTRALLADVQLLLAAPGDPGAGTQELERLRKQVGALGQAGVSPPLGASPFTSAKGQLQGIFTDLPGLTARGATLRCASVATPGREVPLVLPRAVS